MRLSKNFLLFKSARLSIVFVMLLGTLFLSPGTTTAQQNKDGPAQGLQVSPVLIDLNAEAGKTYALKITVTNVTQKELIVKPSVSDFKSRDETGNPEILTEGTSDASYSLQRWVTIPGTFNLKPKENRVITAWVDAPANAEAGGHYGVVRFTAVPVESPDANVNISASVGSLILARINGQINENLQVKSMFVEKNGHTGSIFESAPQMVVERIENTGNVHMKPQGNVTVKDMFGKTIATLNFNKQGGNILPHSIRRYEQPLNKNLFIGRYNASLTATYGTHGGVLLASTSFWVVPFKTIIIALVIVVLLIWLSRRGVRRYNRRVIRKANQRNQK